MAASDASNLRVLHEKLGPDPVGFERFMAVALYDPQIGYYRRPGTRIGLGPESDFFTASNSALFGRLVAAACNTLLEGKLADFTLVEIGAEPGGSPFPDQGHPFKGIRRIGTDDPLQVEGPCVVVSNELFDAQPFRRFRFREGAWRELGVRFEGGGLVEAELGPVHLEPFPSSAPEGYVIDAPFLAAKLAEDIAGQPWSGLFLAFDYGKSWEELRFQAPAGTARAYWRHTQSNDLLARPGEQDLTCHVCWDWIGAALERNGFPEVSLQSQEAFFTRNAGNFISGMVSQEAPRLSGDKLSLLQLLHPANMGQRFQAMHALRR